MAAPLARSRLILLRFSLAAADWLTASRSNRWRMPPPRPVPALPAGKLWRGTFLLSHVMADPAHGQPQFRHHYGRRVVEFLLALPPSLCVKRNSGRALRGHVPDPVRLRPKTPLRADPVVKQLAKRVDSYLSPPLHPDLERFIDPSKLPAFDGGQSPGEDWTNLRAFSLNAWWRQRMI